MEFEAILLIITTGTASVGLIFTGIELHSSNKRKQLELLESVFKDIKNLEQSLYEKFQDEDKLIHWRQLFFQQLEWFSFLVNKKKIKDDELIEFFKNPFIVWCNDMFLEFADKEDIDDPDSFEEMKKLYHKFTGKKLSK